MTALFEMHLRIGGDPGGYREFTLLRSELAKLGHPACPDVDWLRVEQLCLALFDKNGAELQTAAAFVLARSQRHGLEGMTEGVALLETLGNEWARLWPSRSADRLDILFWLFAQMQSLVRTLDLKPDSLPALMGLGSALEYLGTLLERQVRTPMLSLQTLRQQVAILVQRLELSHSPTATVLASVRGEASTPVTPIMVVTPPRTADLPMFRLASRRRPWGLWLLAVASCLALAGWAGWQYLLSGQDRVRGVPEPVRLSSLRLFDAGSAEFKAGSTKALVNALADIKFQPGRMIVISGHTDASGAPDKNLRLSQDRALAVREWIQRMGDIPDSCFVVQGLAASQPIASNESEQGRSVNRRVDIQLLPVPGACG
ncbi:OmpA family protein [Pseudomonas sp. BJa5]|uniref:OmpA family protein n=1 Tax=Pseudomonas sp. BJa5 TaxID=2936270 RepID=UPI002559F77A|nr:OmpA family protein [Pseudomonas sp. BGr12]MDL2423410.1 OmpA family protein [Pseudomonas sp. BGr12]